MLFCILEIEIFFLISGYTLQECNTILFGMQTDERDIWLL